MEKDEEKRDQAAGNMWISVKGKINGKLFS